LTILRRGFIFTAVSLISPKIGEGEKQMIIDDVNDDATMPAADADGEEGGEGADTGEAAEEV